MRRDLLRTSALALAFVGSVGLAAAQQQSPPADAQQQSQQEARDRAGKPRPIGAQQTPSGKMRKEEQSSHAPNAKPEENAVFVNGALAVPGAPANTDMVPAKFSQKNAADDELITVAYTFKTLTDEQRRAIYRALKDQPASAFNADIGTKLPPGIALRPVPDEVAAANDRVLLVGTSRIVVGVFAANPDDAWRDMWNWVTQSQNLRDASAPVTEGRRTP
jgi:hypothetical protein